MTISKTATPEARDNTPWLLIGVVALIGAAGVIAVFTMWRKGSASHDEPPSPRFEELQPGESAPQAQAPAPARVAAPPVDRPGAEKQPEQSILCPRCGRPNSGRTECLFCGKKLR